MSRVKVLHAVGRALIDARDQLNEADSAAGDGDLGITATTIGEVLLAVGPDIDDAEPAAALRAVGLEIGSKAPSTFGTLVSMGLVGASRSLKDGPDAEATHAEVAARVAAAVEAAITARGKAGRGGKTLLDALGPAADALQVAAESGVSLAEAVSLAMLAALEGADETAGMEPTMGRQAWLADRARGTVDPGALAVALAFAAAARALGEAWTPEG